MSTIISIARKEIQADPYKLVYEDTTGDFSLSNLDGYATSVTEVADIGARNALSPSSGDIVDVLDASADTADYGKKRYYWDGTSWVIMNNVQRSEVAIFVQAVIQKTSGDLVLDVESFDHETATEFVVDYPEDGWVKVDVAAVRVKSSLNTQDTLEGIWPDGVSGTLTWDSSTNALQIVTGVSRDGTTITYSYGGISDIFSRDESPQYENSYEDFPYEYLCDCVRTKFDLYMDEKYKNDLSSEAERLYKNYLDSLVTKESICNVESQSLYAEGQKIIERAQLDCACL